MSNETDAKTLQQIATLDVTAGDAETLLRVAAQLQSDAKRHEQSKALQDIGRGAFESIAKMVAALECYYDRLEELRDALKSEGLITAEEREELHDLQTAAGECESREDAENRIHGDPLSIELTGTWALGEKPVADRAILLLGTGGPATRIVCELDDNMQPHRAWIQAQGWGTPWTDYIGGDSKTLLTYCRQFYFGEQQPG